MLGPILQTEMFVPADDEHFEELLQEEIYPILKADMLIRNKLKTKRIIIDDVSYNVYYKYSYILQKDVYFFDQYALFQVNNEDGTEDWVQDDGEEPSLVNSVIQD